MKKNMKKFLTVGMLLAAMFTLTIPALAVGGVVDGADVVVQTAANSVLGDKAFAAAITVGLAAAAGAIGMGWAIAKSAEAISRQPEAEGKIRTTLMLGLVFVETAIIYALVVAILIIFVL